MRRKCKVNWSDIDGASPKPKRLHLEKNETDSLYHCPIQECDHEGAENMLIPSWFFYFDEQPNSKDITDLLNVASSFPIESTSQGQTSETTIHARKLLPSYLLSCDIGEVFMKWLTGSGGDYRKDRAAQQIVTRCFKFLRFCCEDEEELSFDVVDFGLCSPNLLFKFIDYLQDECKLNHGGRLGYIDAISEMIDFRKLHGASEAVFQKFSATAVVPQKSAKDSCKDDEIAVDTRFRH